MDTQHIRAAWLEATLKEEPITVPVPGLEGAHLLIRELSGDAGSDLMEEATVDGRVDQKKMLAGIILKTLRNADDPDKALIFQPADRDALFASGFDAIMLAAKASIELSGLGATAVADAKNASGGAVTPTMTVDGSLSSLPSALDTPTPTPSLPASDTPS